MARTFTLQHPTYEGALVQSPHCHETLQISMLLTGTVDETVGTQTHRGAALHIAVKDAGLVHANRWAVGGARLVRLEAANASLAAVTGDTRAPSWRWRFDPVAVRAFLRIAATGTSAVPVQQSDVSDLLAALVARPADAPRGAPPAWVADIVRCIEEGWSPQLDTGALAQRARVHPVYLARCVRRWYGVSVGDLLRRERLRRTVVRLAGSSARLAEIAYASGFADEAHCARTIRAALGVTPAALRRQLSGPR